MLKRTIEAAAAWHLEQAAIAKTRHSELNRYGDTADERAGWRSWKDAEDRHLAFAAAIRAMPLPETTKAERDALAEYIHENWKDTWTWTEVADAVLAWMRK